MDWLVVRVFAISDQKTWAKSKNQNMTTPSVLECGRCHKQKEFGHLDEKLRWYCEECWSEYQKRKKIEKE